MLSSHDHPPRSSFFLLSPLPLPLLFSIIHHLFPCSLLHPLPFLSWYVSLLLIQHIHTPSVSRPVYTPSPCFLSPILPVKSSSSPLPLLRTTPHHHHIHILFPSPLPLLQAGFKITAIIIYLLFLSEKKKQKKNKEK